MRNITTGFLLVLTISCAAQTRVMTYNIRNSFANDGENKWFLRKQSLVDVIVKTDPDILGTQEVRKDQLEDLKKMLPYYEVYGVGRNNGKHAGEHSTIFYKRDKYALVTGGNFWLSETPDKPGSKSWDADLTRICSWVKLKEKQSGDEFFVFNTHFDHKGKEARVKSAELICKMIDALSAGLPVIVTGDFNFRPEDAGYAVMTATNHKVALKDAYSPDAPNYTDCGFEVSNKKCSRIDYIFYSPHYTPHNYTLHTDNNGTYYPSDHLTISVELSKN